MSAAASGARDPTPEVAGHLVAYLERTTDLVGVTNERGEVVYLNRTARQRLGLDPAAGRVTTADLFPGTVFELYYEQIRPRLLRGEAWNGYLSVRGRSEVPLEMWVTIVGGTGPGGEITWLVVSARDVTEWRHVREELSRKATHDELTGLPTRALLMDRLHVALARARRTGSQVGVMFVDVDELNAVNDRYGHRAGDQVLEEVARRLRDSVRAIDTVARVGGDEFVVLFDGVDDEDEARALATRVHACLEAEAMQVGEHQVNVSASVGVAVGSGDDDGDRLVSEADAAMYHEKGERRSIALGTSADHLVDLRAVTSHDVAVAVTQMAIVPYYQPVVRTATGTLAGFQALARWVRARGEPLAAPDFIGVVKGSAVAFSLDLAILRQAARDLAASGLATTLYVHVSAGFLSKPGVDRFVTEVVQHAGLDAGRLAIVVPGQLLGHRALAVQHTLGALREAGARVVLHLPHGTRPEAPALSGELFSELRFAPGWIRALDTRPQLVAELVRSAHERALLARATAVEDESQFRRLREMGCDLAEGLHIGAPSATLARPGPLPDPR
jgi:diguanylate cyclase (GGDEF)-like protein